MSIAINSQYQQDFRILKSKMESQDDINNFELLVWQLLETRDISVPAKLFTIFADVCSYPEVMWELVHTIEKFSDEDYIKTSLSNLHVFSNAVELRYMLFFRILNHP